MTKTTWRGAVLGAGICLLAGCGGGGSGGSGSAGGNGALTPADLVPAAAAQSAVLYADVSALRPVVDGARWSYHGTHVTLSNVTTIYANAITQAAQGGGRATEAASNPFNGGPDTATLAAGSAGFDSTGPTHSGSASAPLVPELRAPVHAGDQYVVDLETVADSGYDIDADGKRDAMQVAVWRTVVGNEALTLPTIGTVTALRVDQTQVTRIVGSAGTRTQTSSPVVQSVWYVPDIGVARVLVKLPGPSTGFETYEEVLTSFNAGTHGAGVEPRVAAIVPATDPTWGARPMTALYEALRVGDHVVALTGRPDRQSTITASTWFTLMDSRGNVTAMRELPGPNYTYGWKMIAAPNGFAMVGGLEYSGTSKRALVLFDAQANRLDPAAGLTIDLTESGSSFNNASDEGMASDGNTFWFLTNRLSVTGRTIKHQLLARHFDFRGVQIGDDVVLDPDTSTLGGIAAGSIAVSGDRIGVVWHTSFTTHYATWKTGGGAPVSGTLVHSSGYTGVIRPLPGGEFAVSWTNTYAGSPQVAMVRIDAGGNALPEPGLAPDAQVVNSTWGKAPVMLDGAPGTALGQALVPVLINDKYWPTDVYDASLTLLAQYDAGAAGSFLAAPPRIWRLPPSDSPPWDGVATARAIPFDRHVLLLEGGQYSVKATTVWR